MKHYLLMLVMTIAVGYTVHHFDSPTTTITNLQLQLNAQKAQTAIYKKTADRKSLLGAFGVDACYPGATMGNELDNKWQKAYCNQLERGFNTRTGEWK